MRFKNGVPEYTLDEGGCKVFNWSNEPVLKVRVINGSTGKAEHYEYDELMRIREGNDIIIPADSDVIPAGQKQTTRYQPFKRTMPKRVRCGVCGRMMRPGHHH